MKDFSSNSADFSPLLLDFSGWIFYNGTVLWKAECFIFWYKVRLSPGKRPCSVNGKFVQLQHVNVVNIVQFFIHFSVDIVIFRVIIPCVNSVNAVDAWEIITEKPRQTIPAEKNQEEKT